MKLADCYKARKALQVAIGKIKAANTELILNELYLDDDAKFDIVWTLGYELYSEMERFRIPNGN